MKKAVIFHDQATTSTGKELSLPTDDCGSCNNPASSENSIPFPNDNEDNIPIDSDERDAVEKMSIDQPAQTRVEEHNWYCWFITRERLPWGICSSRNPEDVATMGSSFLDEKKLYMLNHCVLGKAPPSLLFFSLAIYISVQVPISSLFLFFAD